MTASTPLFSGTLAAEYEPRFRFFSNVPQVERDLAPRGRPARAAARQPRLCCASATASRARRSRRRSSTPAASTSTTSRATPSTTRRSPCASTSGRVSRRRANGGLRYARYDEPKQDATGASSTTTRGRRGAGIGYDLGGDARARRELHVTRACRRPPTARSSRRRRTASTATLSGEIGPLMTGSLSRRLPHADEPRAPRATSALLPRPRAFGGSLRRELGRSTSVDLQLGRSTAALGLRGERLLREQHGRPGPQLPAAASRSRDAAPLSCFRNDYPNDASKIECPAPGPARSAGRSASAAVSASGRSCAPTTGASGATSNVPGLDVTTTASSSRLGLGLSGGGAR